jgi:hypothetical protein
MCIGEFLDLEVGHKIHISTVYSFRNLVFPDGLTDAIILIKGDL